MSDILDRLQKLGVVKGTGLLHPRPAVRSTDHLNALKTTFPTGIVLENDYGLVFNNRIHTKLDQMHGQVDMRAEIEPNEHFGILTGLNKVQKNRLLAMDIETSGLSAEASGFVFMIGLGYFSDDEYIVDQLILPDLSAERAFLRQIELIYAKFDVLLTYNGKSFDQPMICNRAKFHRLPLKGFQLNHLDLLHLIRRFWKKDLPDCRLSTVEKEILKAIRGEEEVPGYLAPELYRSFLAGGDAEVLKGVAYHNQIDVTSLSALVLHLNQLTANCQNGALENSRFELLERNLRLRRVLADPEPQDAELFCDGCSFSLQNRRKAARQYRKNGQLVSSIRVLESLFNEGDLSAALKLSSLYEEELGDSKTAHEWLEKSLKRLDSDPVIGAWSRKEKKSTIEKRLNRLKAKKEISNEQ